MLKFDADGLVPAIIQDAATGEVLMLAYMNAEALCLTRTTGVTHFWSRSRGQLWRKGEESGHRQEVVAIYVNCEENSLLIRVRQHGPGACHEGYRSCYYRELRADGSLASVMPRAFDPAVVYHMTPTTPAEVCSHRDDRRPVLDASLLAEDRWHDRPTAFPPSEERAGADARLEMLFRQLYRFYERLRDRDVTAASATSRALHEADLPWLMRRARAELDELAGALAGTHRHSGDLVADIELEGYQACYWLCLVAIAARLPYDAVMPHQQVLRGYARAEQGLPLDPWPLRLVEHQHARQEGSEDKARASSPGQGTGMADLLVDGFACIGAACRQAGIAPAVLLERDLAELRTRPYFATLGDDAG